MEEEVQDRIAAATASKPDQVPEQLPPHDSLQIHEVYTLLHIR